MRVGVEVGLLFLVPFVPLVSLDLEAFFVVLSLFQEIAAVVTRSQDYIAPVQKGKDAILRKDISWIAVR